jgi:hypothetical protein
VQLLKNGPLRFFEGDAMSDGFLKMLDGLMTKLASGGYESEHTKFMNEWLAKHPEQVEDQATGRALWWDKQPVSLDEAKITAASALPVKPYYYQTE